MRRTSHRLGVLAAAAAITAAAVGQSPALGLTTHTKPGHRAAAAVATAAAVQVPGDFSGLGFDACQAPSQDEMDEWRSQSPYWGVGVYIGGENRSCPQPDLTSTWVSTQHHRGWHIFPIWVGPQAPEVGGTIGSCVDHAYSGSTMSPDNASARSEGVSAANHAVRRATGLGMAKGSTLFLDMESYKNDLSDCNQPVQNFQSGWSARLHAHGWKSGYYSSLATGINALDFVRTTFPGTYVMPDAVWFARHDDKANLDGSPYLSDSHWSSRRVHQYSLDVAKTYGTVTLTVDENAIAIGRGSQPGPARDTCGVDLDFTHYRTLSRGDRSTQVTAAQCLLRQQRLFPGRLTGRFDLTTARGVGRWQQRSGLPVTRHLDSRTWTSLLSAGSRPLVKRGSASDRVRFLQRGLTAALAEPLTIDGVFGTRTTSAVRAYQQAVDLPVTGIVDRATWTALQSGHR